jgi:antitoxin component YwqK of YwqJK toxin-antitoxin module
MREIIYFFILIIVFSCNSIVLYSELNHDDGVSFYNEKKFSGLAIEKDKFDNIRVEKLYNEGINLSTKLFDSKGNIESEWIYAISNILVTRFFDSGKVESKEVFDRSLVRNGESISFYRNGNKKSEWNFKNGLRDGIQKNYFANGKLSDEREMSNGKEDGFTRIYNREGELLKEIFFKHGIATKI